ncbi:uncharacterized protein LOC128397547 [Panonychus citri]|uniref:uncharacterized protein LOC128397547 n=1 Tax=Panonychus citri TaxID=50023 RepID=UPI0023083383|nr:uncharacterized protein LOC128397547 [Panonychus citri]
MIKMGKLIVTCVLITMIVSCLADPERPGKYLNHDRTVINCAKYKREANQHQCVLSPINVEGPFYLPDDHERSDITDGQPGIPLELTINLVNSNDCNPMGNMYVHIWSANAVGKYSGVENFGPSEEFDKGQGGQHPEPGKGKPGPGLPGRPDPVTDERFLRGYQVTDSNGQVNFKTIIPGWYFPRCLHIHIEVYPKNTTEKADILFVGQIYFKTELANELKLIDPYSANTNPITLNENDDLFTERHGNETLLNLINHGNNFSTTITFGINPEAKIEIEV